MPVASKALSVPVAGQQAWERISSALAADLVVIRTQTAFGRGKRKKPVDVELHVNPLGLGAAAVGAGLTLWLMQLRAAPTATEVEYGKWVWPSDGTDASKELMTVSRGAPPTRTVPAYAPPPTAFSPFPTTSTTERASWSVTQTKTETHFAIKQRVGFLGNGAGTESEHDAWYYATTPGWKIIRNGLFGW